MRWNQDPAPRLHHCFLAASPLSLHPLPSWISNCSNLSFGTQGRSRRLESRNRGQKGFHAQEPHRVLLSFTVNTGGKQPEVSFKEHIQCQLWRMQWWIRHLEFFHFKHSLWFKSAFYFPSIDTLKRWSPHWLLCYCSSINPLHQVSSNMQFFSTYIKTLFFFPFPTFPFSSSAASPHGPYIFLPYPTPSQCPNIAQSLPFSHCAILYRIFLTKIHSYFKIQAKSHHSNWLSFILPLTLNIHLFIRLHYN